MIELLYLVKLEIKSMIFVGCKKLCNGVFLGTDLLALSSLRIFSKIIFVLKILYCIKMSGKFLLIYCFEYQN